MGYLRKICDVCPPLTHFHKTTKSKKGSDRHAGKTPQIRDMMSRRWQRHHCNVTFEINDNFYDCRLIIDNIPHCI